MDWIPTREEKLLELTAVLLVKLADANLQAAYGWIAAESNKGFAKQERGWQKVAAVCRENGAQRNDLGKQYTEPPAGGEA